MKPTTRSSHSATIPMQLRWRKQRRKSFSHQGNSKPSVSIAKTSGISRRIIQRICTFWAWRSWELIGASFLVGLVVLLPDLVCMIDESVVVAFLGAGAKISKSSECCQDEDCQDAAAEDFRPR